MKSRNSIFTYFYFVVIVVTIAIADKSAKAKNNTTDVPTKTKMQNILGHMQTLRPYMVDFNKFRNQKNQGFISDNQKNLVSLKKDAKHKRKLFTPAISVSRQVLENHFAEIQR